MLSSLLIIRKQVYHLFKQCILHTDSENAFKVRISLKAAMGENAVSKSCLFTGFMFIYGYNCNMT